VARRISPLLLVSKKIFCKNRTSGSVFRTTETLCPFAASGGKTEVGGRSPRREQPFLRGRRQDELLGLIEE
jgi:hypothetical protein